MQNANHTIALRHEATVWAMLSRTPAKANGKIGSASAASPFTRAFFQATLRVTDEVCASILFCLLIYKVDKVYHSAPHLSSFFQEKAQVLHFLGRICAKALLLFTFQVAFTTLSVPFTIHLAGYTPLSEVSGYTLVPRPMTVPGLRTAEQPTSQKSPTNAPTLRSPVG